MTAADNKAVVQRFIDEFVNGKNYDLADELFTEDYLRHDPQTPSGVRGVEPFLEAMKDLNTAFPDSEVHVGEIIAEDDLVSFEGRMTATHEGTFQGIAPTGNEVDVQGNAMHRVRDGRIAETWATWDFLGVLQQIGAVEAPIP